MEFVTLFVDTIITVLLAVTIYYCWKLNRFLNAIRDSKGELAQTIKSFDEATTRSQESVKDLKVTTQAIADKIQVKIDKAEFLADDLAYMIDKANKLAGKLGKEVSRHNTVTHRMAEANQPDVIPDEEEAPRKAAAQPASNRGIEHLTRSRQGAEQPAAQGSDGKQLSKAELALMEALKSIK